MSSKYEKVLKYYRTCVWHINQVRNAVVKGWITEEEYYMITGENYE